MIVSALKERAGLLGDRKGLTLQETSILVICILILIGLVFFISRKLLDILTVGS